MEATERRIGLEQEFFLVDGEGVPSNRADEFLSRCREIAAEEGLEPESFVEEVSRSIIEINNPPARTVAGLAETYLASLDLALRAGREIGVRLYPLATYPLPVAPTLREDPSYELQIRTVGHARFLNAADARRVRTSVVALAACNLLLVYTHYYGWLVVACEAALVAFKERRRLGAFLLAFGGLALAYAPCMPVPGPSDQSAPLCQASSPVRNFSAT